jgi:hypothetical protein
VVIRAKKAFEETRQYHKVERAVEAPLKALSTDPPKQNSDSDEEYGDLIEWNAEACAELDEM